MLPSPTHSHCPRISRNRRPAPRGMARCAALAALIAVPAAAYVKPAPVLETYSRTVRVTNVQQLVSALADAVPGRTILLADGFYDVSQVEPLRIRKDSVMLYGESRDPTKVTFKGQGFKSANIDEEMIKIEARNTTIAYLTIRDVRANGLKIQTGGNHGLLVHNVYFIDICERAIKGPDVEPSRNGIVRYSLFEQKTPITSAIPNLRFDGDYIAGMDMMKIEDWRIHDNVFRNIKGMNGGGRAGVFLWVNCKNVTVENNLFMGCDRAISFGNPAGTEDMSNSLIRNNFIVAGNGISIEICNAIGTRIYHNTVYSTNPSFARTMFLMNTGANNSIKNNLVFGKITVQGGTKPDTAGNLFLSSGSAGAWFVNAPEGDLHLVPGATRAVDKGVKVEGAELDWDGKSRMGNPDIGADELGNSSGSSIRPKTDIHGPKQGNSDGIFREGNAGTLKLVRGGSAFRFDGKLLPDSRIPVTKSLL